MDKYFHPIIFLALLLFANTTFATEWRAGCLSECFATGHDCDYCAYQCEKTYRNIPIPNYDGDTICPFIPYDPYNDNYG